MARVAAIALLAMFGHGLLMTSGVDAAHCPSLTARQSQPGPVLHCPAHDISCFTIQTVVKSTPMPLPPLPNPFVVALPVAAPEVMAPFVTVATAPGHPPDIVRALLQVYRN